MNTEQILRHIEQKEADCKSAPARTQGLESYSPGKLADDIGLEMARIATGTTDPHKISKALMRCLGNRVRKADEEARRQSDFLGWALGLIKGPGQWLPAISFNAKKHFGDHATKDWCEGVLRKCGELTAREQPWGDDGGTMLAFFPGKPVPHMEHEEQPLPMEGSV